MIKTESSYDEIFLDLYKSHSSLTITSTTGGGVFDRCSPSSGDTGATLDSHDAGPSPHQQLLGVGGSGKSSGAIRKRRTASERAAGIVHTSPVNSTTNNGPADYATHNNNNNNNNNNHVKNERLSPGTPEPTSMVVNSRRSRSRSVTPSPVASHPSDTPPTSEHGGLPGRNYSDIMRSLAAKYNNNNPNDYFNVARNGLPPASLDPRFRPGFSFPPVALLPSLSAIPTSSSSSKEGIEAAVPLTASSVAAAAAAAALKNKTEMPPFLTPFAPMIDMSSTQALLAMYKSAKEVELHQMLKGVKRPESSSPLDLSAGAIPPPMKRIRTSKQPPASSSPLSKREHSESPKIHNHQEDISHWSVDDVCNFVSSIDICAEYAQTFRDQRIDGSGLPLLTEDHLTATMQMKLGPALKLRSILGKKLGSCNVCLHCTHCHNRGSPEPSGNGSTSDSGGGTS